MKKILIFISCLFFLSCDSHNDGEESLKEPAWLHALIQKSKTDQTGHYIGSIWLMQYEEKDFYVTDMGLGSGGIAYWIFDSSGRHFAHPETKVCTACKFVENKHFYIEANKLPLLSEFKKNGLIYSSFPVDDHD